jgi:hypothetical protein
MEIVKPKKRKILNITKPIMLSCESYVPYDALKVNVLDEKKRITQERLAYLDHISRNRCYYPMEDVLDSLKKSRYIQECIAQGIWFGELEHPSTPCDLKRFMNIDDLRVSHRVLKYWREGDFLMGMVQYLEPLGPIVWSWIEQGVNIAKSLRIYTPNYIKCRDQDGEYVKKVAPMHPCAFDTVKLPGYESVRLQDPTEFARQNKYYLSNGSLSLESVNVWFLDNVQDQINDVLASSEEYHIIQDLYDVDENTAKSYSIEDGIVTFLKDGKNIQIHGNPYIFNEIMNKGIKNE